MPPKNKPLSAKQESPVGENESLFWEERLWLRVHLIHGTLRRVKSPLYLLAQE